MRNKETSPLAYGDIIEKNQGKQGYFEKIIEARVSMVFSRVTLMIL